MTENTQPGGGATANGDRPAALAEYNKQRQNLKELLTKRKQQDRQLAQLEQNIVDLEAKYLSNTRFGNIVKGFDNYIKGTSSAAQRKQGELKEEDYIWSRSSISHNSLHPDNVDVLSAISTPAAPTPISTTFGGGTRDSGSGQPTPTSATEKSSNKGSKHPKKRPHVRKGGDLDGDDSENESRDGKKIRTHFGAARK
ncbi:NuA4-domain-containing protein [Annulohypoxylon maeteangense]|uniref:NuA4-domain-containing protein n=1 Tax=Annulohypoxylon maeteangense TaxID=1927788 RepID=UPI00200872BD|nr:NuA4-domain-containing protein [Annulohypoxylon maeteangense]KAI0889937.1 NuA4-domain-containing protein [Annulohypoxylon maeteangense]